jgi:hypothetical protein
MSLYAVVGVSLFEDVDHFKSFSSGLLTMAIIATFENWTTILFDVVDQSHIATTAGECPTGVRLHATLTCYV